MNATYGKPAKSVHAVLDRGTGRCIVQFQRFGVAIETREYRLDQQLQADADIEYWQAYGLFPASAIAL